MNRYTEDALAPPKEVGDLRSNLAAITTRLMQIEDIVIDMEDNVRGPEPRPVSANVDKANANPAPYVGLCLHACQILVGLDTLMEQLARLRNNIGQ
jgi:hypothetical protein